MDNTTSGKKRETKEIINIIDSGKCVPMQKERLDYCTRKSNRTNDVEKVVHRVNTRQSSPRQSAYRLGFDSSLNYPSSSECFEDGIKRSENKNDVREISKRGHPLQMIRELTEEIKTKVEEATEVLLSLDLELVEANYCNSVSYASTPEGDELRRSWNIFQDSIQILLEQNTKCDEKIEEFILNWLE